MIFRSCDEFNIISHLLEDFDGLQPIFEVASLEEIFFRPIKDLQIRRIAKAFYRIQSTSDCLLSYVTFVSSWVKGNGFEFLFNSYNLMDF